MSNKANEWKYLEGWGGKWSDRRIYVQSYLTGTLIVLLPYGVDYLLTLFGRDRYHMFQTSQSDRQMYFFMAILFVNISFMLAYISRILLDFKSRIEKLENKI